MIWLRRKTDSINDLIAEREKEAENATIMSQVGYLAAEQMSREAEKLNKKAGKVAKAHKRLQTENHFGEKIYGVVH